MLEDGCYNRLLDVYYTREKPLPHDEAAVCRLVRAISKEEKRAVIMLLKEFFSMSDAGWHNKRADEEIAKYQAKADANRSNGKAGGRPKRTQEKPSGFPVGSDSQTQNNLNQNQEPEPLTKTKEKASAFALPDWVPAEPWKAWLEVRKRMKAPNTDYALGCAVKDLERLRDAGDDPQAVLDRSTSRGWRGLFPLNGTGSNAMPDYSALYDKLGVPHDAR